MQKKKKEKKKGEKENKQNKKQMDMVKNGEKKRKTGDATTELPHPCLVKNQLQQPREK